jgi:hypothetical protein
MDYPIEFIPDDKGKLYPVYRVDLGKIIIHVNKRLVDEGLTSIEAEIEAVQEFLNAETA